MFTYNEKLIYSKDEEYKYSLIYGEKILKTNREHLLLLLLEIINVYVEINNRISS